RNSGYGKEMVELAVATVKSYGGNKISIGIIEENVKLKDWYLKLGFNHISTRKFEHLPFTVGLMEMNV
ncbi:MAG: GNAT family N-acetyltransferase, partial [Clostridia bacterium]|nr:GNAT family N-acetyltransferase [Clostridia bacterium]